MTYTFFLFSFAFLPNNTYHTFLSLSLYSTLLFQHLEQNGMKKKQKTMKNNLSSTHFLFSFAVLPSLLLFLHILLSVPFFSLFLFIFPWPSFLYHDKTQQTLRQRKKNKSSFRFFSIHSFLHISLNLLYSPVFVFFPLDLPFCITIKNSTNYKIKKKK